MPETRAAVAGTFGPLHDGHRRLLRTALKYGERVPSTRVVRGEVDEHEALQ